MPCLPNFDYLMERDHNAVTPSQPIEFEKHLLSSSELKPKPKLSDPIAFGRMPTDHMLVCDYLPDQGGWQRPIIQPFQNFQVSPSAVVFHYGQTIFEGLKAYRSDKGTFLFRPELNAQRMANSARRLGMEPVPTELFLACVRELVSVERDWVLPAPGSLYIRPTLIPLDEGVSYRGSKAYRFFVILSPAKNYYSKETAIAVYVEREKVRAVRGGVGEAKCGGNYAAALPSLNKAVKLGAEQVLWLDAIEHEYVEEVGAMNVMFVYGNEIITPALTGSILPGVTRNSILTLAAHLGYQVSEQRISIDKIIADARSGILTEVFGCGTAAVISPIHSFIFDTETVTINEGKIGAVTQTLKSALIGIQSGEATDPFGWRQTLAL